MASIGDSPPLVNPMPVLVHAELYGAEPQSEATLQRDTEARFDVIQNILDQFAHGGVSWREVAVRIKVIAQRLPDRMGGEL